MQNEFLGLCTMILLDIFLGPGQELKLSHRHGG